jgi:hypothetical protein
MNQMLQARNNLTFALDRRLPTARDFRDEFFGAYEKARTELQVNGAWPKKIWNNWNKFVLGDNPPRGVKKTLLARTATSLGLRYEKRERLGLDAVFSKPSNSWFPIVVAIEHENTSDGFHEEVEKLMSVRCALKVGITLTLSAAANCKAKLNKIERTIMKSFQAVSEIAEEDHRTEYLFLVGTEVREKRNEISWYALNFSVPDGPRGKPFQAMK